jgi:hypothetical protein
MTGGEMSTQEATRVQVLLLPALSVARQARLATKV